MDTEAEAEITELSWQELPMADIVELRRLSSPESSADRSIGLTAFLSSDKYLVYPGLRFRYRAPGTSESSDYEVTAVTARGDDVGVARAGETTRHAIARTPGLPPQLPAYHHIGGLQLVIDLLRREIELPLRRPEEFRAIDISAVSGVLLYGPPGTGKTLLARAVAFHSGVEEVTLSGSELASWPRAKAEQEIRTAFDPANKLVIIDDIDYLTPSRAKTGNALSLLGPIQRLLDQPGRPVVIATTSRRDDIDPAIQRHGRIGRHVPVPAPNENARREILRIHIRDLPLSDQPKRKDLIADLAQRTAGFVGADLEALCQEAGRLALRRVFPVEVLERPMPEAQALPQIEAEDWREALTLVTPSAIGGIISETPPTKFSDVVGLDETITMLKERLVLPLRHPELFAEADVKMERGVLLYGPPGTGKTLLAGAIANECGCRFMSVRGPELLTKWFGESEQAVRDLFDRARSAAPCVVFFDEIEAIARRRTGSSHDAGTADRVVDQLLAEIDGLVDLGQVAIIGATNDEKSLDPAILRPGRLGLHVEVPLPDGSGRQDLFALYLNQAELQPQYSKYAQMTASMSGADIKMIAREAKLNALRRAEFSRVLPVTDEDVTEAIETSQNRQQALPLS